MNKKFLSLVLALVMVLGTFGNVFAAAAPEKKEEAKKEAPAATSTDAKVQWLIDNKIVIGYAGADNKADGNMGLKDNIRRDAVAKMLVFAMGEQDLAARLQGVYRPFPDVETTSIVNGFIATAASKTSNGVPIIAGYEDGTFRPTREVTYAELAKMLVVAIDKDLNADKVKGMKWYQGWMDRAVQLGIFEGLSIDNANAKAVRKDAFAMIYNAFFKLREVKPVPANETRGIISEKSNGTTLVLNQGEFKKEFKVNDNTVFVRNGVPENPKWLKNFNSEYYVGSLVRVLADKDGVATHVIEMGNPAKGVKNVEAAWVDLGKVQLTPVKLADKVKLEDKAIKDAGNKEYDVTSKTEFYVADVKNDVLTKVKDYAAAKELVGDETSNVYLGYEYLPVSKKMEARVVVFHMVKEDKTLRNVRVTAPASNQSYEVTVQAPGVSSNKVERFSVKTNDQVWPYNYSLKADDVVAVNARGQVRAKVIDSADTKKFPIVQVAEFLKIEGNKETRTTVAGANAVKLVDKFGQAVVYDLPTDFDAFFADQLVAGKANVQFKLDGTKIEVLSVVNKALDGKLTEGKVFDTNVKTGVVEKIVVNTNGLSRVFIKENDAPVATEYLFVNDGTVNKFVKGEVVKFKATGFNRNDTKPEIVLVSVVKDTARLALEKTYNDEFAKLPAVKDITNEKYDAAKAPALKTLIDNAVTAYNALQADNDDVKTKADAKEALNKVVDAYNALTAAANAQANKAQ